MCIRDSLKGLHRDSTAAADQIADGTLHIIDGNRVAKGLSLIHIWDSRSLSRRLQNLRGLPFWIG